MPETVGIVGDGPVVEAIRAALSDVDVEPTAIDLGGVPERSIAVVVGRAGDPGFERANALARESETPWLAVEIGGIGGIPIDGLDAAVCGFAPGTACYDCLSTRVEANDPNGTDEPRADRGAVRLAGAFAGRELVAAIEGEGDVLGGIVEIPYARRRLLPVPNCEGCDGSAPESDRFHEERPLEDAIGRVEPAVDDRVGIVRSVGEAESFPAPYYLATLAETDGFSDASAPAQAAGVDADWNAAYMKALGEALERYSGAIYRRDEFEHDSADDPEFERAVRPASFVREGVEDASGSIPWVGGERLADGERVRLPAEFVHFPPPERRFGPTITTGMGLGNSPVEAALSGLYEVVERDATMIGWYSTFDPLKLRVEDEGFETLARRARGEGLAVTPLLVTQDVDVPVVTVAVHREGEWPRFAVGSDADLEPAQAARSALAEALQNWMELRSMGRDAAADESGWIGRYAGLPEEARAFLDARGEVGADRVGPADPPSGAAELDALVDRVRDAGMEPYAAWLTPRDVRALGFEAARVLVPGAQPLFTGDPVFGERVERVPESLGFEPRLDREPHPYP